jgi:diphosphomevalonate decarboxylase
MSARASAVAHSNIALIKYWGKADTRLALPATSSVSLTLVSVR